MAANKSARVIVTSPGRNFVTLEIETAEGITGLCVEIDEALAAKRLYRRAHLPVNRLEDGTLFNW